jgi:hypothetical protein
MKNVNAVIGRASLRAGIAAAALALGLAAAQAAFAQKVFPTPEAAMNAFGDALSRSDSDEMKSVLGADYHRFIPPVGEEIRYAFLSQWAKNHGIKPEGADRAAITVGKDGWTLPIPLVKDAQGWSFDVRAGAEEIRIRRIGRNEHGAMQAMLAIYDAQREYATIDRNGNGLREYATKLESSPGKKDGLYWPAGPGEPESPLGPAFAQAKAAGGSAEAGYYGFRYRLLGGQGKNAPGGAYDFTVRGKTIGGFAAIAWPVRYGDTGVMTFMVSHDGVLYEKDLGPNTATRAAAITRFDPDSTWKKVSPED